MRTAARPTSIASANRPSVLSRRTEHSPARALGLPEPLALEHDPAVVPVLADQLGRSEASATSAARSASQSPDRAAQDTPRGHRRRPSSQAAADGSLLDELAAERRIRQSAERRLPDAWASLELSQSAPATSRGAAGDLRSRGTPGASGRARQRHGASQPAELERVEQRQRPSASGGRSRRSNEGEPRPCAPCFRCRPRPENRQARRRSQATGDRLARSAVRLVAPLAATPTPYRGEWLTNSARCVILGKPLVIARASSCRARRPRERASRRPLLALGDATHPIDSRPRGEQHPSPHLPSPFTFTIATRARRSGGGEFTLCRRLEVLRRSSRQQPKRSAARRASPKGLRFETWTERAPGSIGKPGQPRHFSSGLSQPAVRPRGPTTEFFATTPASLQPQRNLGQRPPVRQLLSSVRIPTPAAKRCASRARFAGRPSGDATDGG